MKFLRGQATRLSCFATCDTAFSVAIAESFFRIGLGSAHEDATTLQSWLLRMGCERPCRCRGPDQRNELSPPHSITLPARPAGVVLRLMTISALVDCRLTIANTSFIVLTFGIWEYRADSDYRYELTPSQSRVASRFE